MYEAFSSKPLSLSARLTGNIVVPVILTLLCGVGQFAMLEGHREGGAVLQGEGVQLLRQSHQVLANLKQETQQLNGYWSTEL